MRKRRGVSLKGPAFPKEVHYKIKVFRLKVEQIRRLEELKAQGFNVSGFVRVTIDQRLDEWACRGNGLLIDDI